MRIEQYNLDGRGYRDHEVYDMPPSPEPRNPYWGAVTSVPCPVDGCEQTVVWYEAGYVPGYRVCMRRIEGSDRFDEGSIRHRFLAKGNAGSPMLIRENE